MADRGYEPEYLYKSGHKFLIKISDNLLVQAPNPVSDCIVDA